MSQSQNQTLLLIPTAMERDRLLPHLRSPWPTHLCGFGVIAAAAITARLIADHRPRAVVLAGIAGSLDESVLPGTAVWFDEVRCHGIGVGQGDDFQSAGSIGWPQCVDDNGRIVGDHLPLHHPETPHPPETSYPPETSSPNRILRTVCAASTRIDQNANDGSIAEDMEGFAVALACRLSGVRCSIVRGISNIAGDRDHARWRIDDALRAIAARLSDMSSSDVEH